MGYHLNKLIKLEKIFLAIKSKLLLILTVVLGALAVILNWMFVIPAVISFIIAIEAGETDFIKERFFPENEPNS